MVAWIVIGIINTILINAFAEFLEERSREKSNEEYLNSKEHKDWERYQRENWREIKRTSELAEYYDKIYG